MGDMMLLGVLRMRMDNPTPLQLAQFTARARQAADRIEADAKEIERLREAITEANEAMRNGSDSTAWAILVAALAGKEGKI